jgi:hypothetical protein
MTFFKIANCNYNFKFSLFNMKNIWGDSSYYETVTSPIILNYA